MKNDEQKGLSCKTAQERLRKKQEKEALEEARIQGMKELEKSLYEKGMYLVAGMDEAGRGPLAGPVVAAAVILPPDSHIHGVNDSKKITEKKRELLFESILQEAVGWGIGVVEPSVIDRINILQATRLAMKTAVEKLREKTPVEHLLIDAVSLEEMDVPQSAIIKGDQKSYSIAAASIVAKVTRDRLMFDYDRLYPGYGFGDNKGYGTKAHYQGIRQQGICPIHRRSFLKHIKERQNITL